MKLEHVKPMHEGGELGYALMHAVGAAFDDPELVVFCAIGDGEAETGPLAASWHCAKSLNPATDGAALPMLQLNGRVFVTGTTRRRVRQDLAAAYDRRCARSTGPGRPRAAAATRAP